MHAARHDHPHRHIDAAFAAGVALNLIFVAVEGTFGVIGHSLALLADAGHNLSDVFSLALAWMAAWIARRAPTARRTYGFGRGTILASLVNAMLLLIAVGGIVWEALMRLADPRPPDGYTMAIVAAVGILVNGGTALMLLRGSRADLNVRSAYFHMAADAAVSAGVVAAGLLLARTGWRWIDPVASMAIALAIALSSVALLKESLDLALDAVPPAVDRDAVRAFLLGQAGVAGIHDLHIWSLSTTSVALTAHLVMPAGVRGDEFLHGLSARLHEHFGIDHVTLQIEQGDGNSPCRLAPEQVI
jgi:cobalt-zinc-cadmium efflux system protein